MTEALSLGQQWHGGGMVQVLDSWLDCYGPRVHPCSWHLPCHGKLPFPCRNSCVITTTKI